MFSRRSFRIRKNTQTQTNKNGNDAGEKLDMPAVEDDPREMGGSGLNAEYVKIFNCQPDL